MDKVTLSEYWDMLDKHDWWHMYSDDSGVDRRGAANMNKLSTIAGQSPEHTAMLIAFRSHWFTGKPWNSEQTPKPERPLTDSVNSDSVEGGGNV